MGSANRPKKGVLSLNNSTGRLKIGSCFSPRQTTMDVQHDCDSDELEMLEEEAEEVRRWAAPGERGVMGDVLMGMILHRRNK